MLNLVEMLELANQEKEKIVKERDDRQIKIRRAQENVTAAFRNVFDALSRAGISTGPTSIGSKSAQIDVYKVSLNLSIKYVYDAIERDPDLDLVEFVKDMVHKSYRSNIGLKNEA